MLWAVRNPHPEMSNAARKPPFAQLLELQRKFFALRWKAICDRGDQTFYTRAVDTHVVSFALGHPHDIGAHDVIPAGEVAQPEAAARNNLPSFVEAASPFLSSAFLLIDSATCGALTRHRKFVDFGDGMISYNAKEARVEFYPETVRGYRSRRLAIASSLVYVWLFFGLILFWIWRKVTGRYPNLLVPPYGSGTIHLVLCMCVVLAYVVGITVVPRHRTVGMRAGALPSLLPLVLQTRNNQFMSSYAWSSRYVGLVRSLSTVLADCWLDVRELTPGDRVTQEIAHAAATVRCLIVFFSYEYLRSVNCTLEFLTALRYRGSPQRTIILLEALSDEPVETKGGVSNVTPLTREEAADVADILTTAIPGLFVVKSIDELISVIDQNCVRAVDAAGTANTIDWWAKHGTPRVSRVSERVRVVPPIMRQQLDNYWSFICSCRGRRRGDVAGGFALLSGDGSKVDWYRPPDAATITILVVLVFEVIVFAHMFVYCAEDVVALTEGHTAFQGSCIPSSTFMYVVSLLPLGVVAFQYFVNMRVDPAHLHDDILLPLNVAAHSAALAAIDDAGEATAVTSRNASSAVSFFQAVRTAAATARLVSEPVPERAIAPVLDPSGHNSSAVEGFTMVFVQSEDPCDIFRTFCANMASFLTHHATGIPTRVIPISQLPVAAQRLSVYVFMLDSAASVDAFYRRVHCRAAGQAVGHMLTRRAAAAAAAAAAAEGASLWPTCQILVVCHPSVIATRPGTPGPARTAATKLPLQSSASRLTAFVGVRDSVESAEAIRVAQMTGSGGTGLHGRPSTPRSGTPRSSAASAVAVAAASEGQPTGVHSLHRELSVVDQVAAMGPETLAARVRQQRPQASTDAADRDTVTPRLARFDRVDAGAAGVPPGAIDDSPFAVERMVPSHAVSAAVLKLRGKGRQGGVNPLAGGAASPARPLSQDAAAAMTPRRSDVPSVGARATAAMAAPSAAASPASPLTGSSPTAPAASVDRGAPLDGSMALPRRVASSDSMLRRRSLRRSSTDGKSLRGPPVTYSPLGGGMVLARPRRAAGIPARAPLLPLLPLRPFGQPPDRLATSIPKTLQVRWIRAIISAAKALQKLRLRLDAARLPPVALNLPATGADGCLSPHLRSALFEYLLIMTGAKQGVDPSSPYDSLAQALLDSVGRKVGSILEKRTGKRAVHGPGHV